MYEQFYGLHERPFSLLPDPDFLYYSEQHLTAIATLEMAVVNNSGFCVLSGEIGAGKTTIVRELLNRLDEKVTVGLVTNTHSSFGDLMQWILAAYGLEAQGTSRIDMHQQFIDFVIQEYANNRHTLLIIDEAQQLSSSALDVLRMLSNINSDQDLVLQVILIGQKELREKLQQPELHQFAQRIAIHYHLSGLSEDQTISYIRHRLSHAGADREIFDDDACRLVFASSKGIPRLINRLCDICLVFGFAENARHIGPELVTAAELESQGDGVSGAARFPISRQREARPATTDAILDTSVATGEQESAAHKPDTGQLQRPEDTHSPVVSENIKPGAEDGMDHSVAAHSKDTGEHSAGDAGAVRRHAVSGVSTMQAGVIEDVGPASGWETIPLADQDEAGHPVKTTTGIQPDNMSPGSAAAAPRGTATTSRGKRRSGVWLVSLSVVFVAIALWALRDTWIQAADSPGDDLVTAYQAVNGGWHEIQGYALAIGAKIKAVVTQQDTQQQTSKQAALPVGQHQPPGLAEPGRPPVQAGETPERIQGTPAVASTQAPQARRAQKSAQVGFETKGLDTVWQIDKNKSVRDRLKAAIQAYELKSGAGTSGQVSTLDGEARVSQLDTVVDPMPALTDMPAKSIHTHASVSPPVQQAAVRSERSAHPSSRPDPVPAENSPVQKQGSRPQIPVRKLSSQPRRVLKKAVINDSVAARRAAAQAALARDRARRAQVPAGADRVTAPRKAALAREGEEADIDWFDPSELE